MDDVKKTYREGEQETKEAWRKADGDESVADKVGNVGDEVRKDLGNAGDDLSNAADRSAMPARKLGARPTATRSGRQDRQRRRRPTPHRGRPR
jgi:hypothetical protein